MNEAQKLRIGQIIQELDELSHRGDFADVKKAELMLESLSLRLRAEELIAAIDHKIWVDRQMSKRSR